MNHIIHKICLFLVCLAILFLPACSSGADNRSRQSNQDTNNQEPDKQKLNGQETAAEDSQNKKLIIGITIYRYDDNFMKLYRTELKRYLEEKYGAEVMMRNARGSQEEQEAQIQQFLEAGCDGIIVNLVDVSKAGKITDLCNNAGVPLVFINREPDEEEQKRWEENEMQTACISTDSRQAGTYQGEMIAQLPDQGDRNRDGIISYVMIMGERGNEDSLLRTEYAVQAMKASGKNIKKLFTSYGNWNKDQGKKIAAKALELHGDQIEVILCNNDAMALGALEAIEESGKTAGKDLYVVGVDALEEAVIAVGEGRMAGTVLNDHTGQSHSAADALTAMISGEKAEVKYSVDYIKITNISTDYQ